MELCLGMHSEPAERLWVTTKKKTSVGDSVMSVYCRPPDKEVDEAFCRN